MSGILLICNSCLSVQLRCQSGEVGVLVLEDAGNDGGVEVKKEEDDEQEEEEERRRELERQRAREREREAEREREREREQREKLRSEELKRKDCDTLKMLRAELK